MKDFERASHNIATPYRVVVPRNDSHQKLSVRKDHHAMPC